MEYNFYLSARTLEKIADELRTIGAPVVYCDLVCGDFLNAMCLQFRDILDGHIIYEIDLKDEGFENEFLL